MAVLLPILGTSWVFGVLAVNDRALVFQYMFAILNSLQVRARWDCHLGSVSCKQCVGSKLPQGQQGGPNLCSLHTPIY